MAPKKDKVLVMIGRKEPPTLTQNHLTSEGWRKFKKEDELYKIALHDGEEAIALRFRIDYVVRDYLSRKTDEELTDKKIYDIMDESTGYAHAHDLLTDLSKLKCTSTALPEVAKYIADFAKIAEVNDKYPTKTLSKCFIRGIQHEMMRRHMFGLEPELSSLKDVYDMALREAEEFERLARKRSHLQIVEGNSPNKPNKKVQFTTNSNKNHKSGNNYQKSKNNDNNKNSNGRKLVCHGCGHPGHVRPKCPNKGVPGWVAAPGRAPSPLPLTH